MTKRIIRKKGYVVEIGYDETRWGKFNEAYEHRVVVQEYIGSKLPTGAVVHHIDRVRDHNKIENLLLLPSQDIHLMLHRYMNDKNQVLIDAVSTWSREWMDRLRRENLSQPGAFEKVELTAEISAAAITLDGGNLSLPVTSLFDQYMDLKEAFPSHLALIQVGSFYTAYEDDAQTLNRLFRYKLYTDPFTKLVATGTGILNRHLLRDLRDERVPYVLVKQSNRVRRGRVLDRHIEERYDG